MSMDKSLKTKNSLERHRNVLSRTERIEKLKESDLWKDGQSPYGLPKVGHRKVAAGKKIKVKKEGEESTDDAAATDSK